MYVCAVSTSDIFKISNTPVVLFLLIKIDNPYLHHLSNYSQLPLTSLLPFTFCRREYTYFLKMPSLGRILLFLLGAVGVLGQDFGETIEKNQIVEVSSCENSRFPSTFIIDF